MWTDHRPLNFITAASEHNKKLARWWAEILSINTIVEYIKGKNNTVPDILHRMTVAVEDADVNEFLGYNFFIVWDCVIGGFDEEKSLHRA